MTYVDDFCVLKISIKWDLVSGNRFITKKFNAKTPEMGIFYNC